MRGDTTSSAGSGGKGGVWNMALSRWCPIRAWLFFAFLAIYLCIFSLLVLYALRGLGNPPAILHVRVRS